MMRQKIVAANWKMNKTFDEGLLLVNEIIANENKKPSPQVLKIIAPPFILLKSVSDKSQENKNFSVAAQNCHHEISGAFTGEVSASMIKSTGATYVIIGHSERRQYFSETNLLLSKKVDVALNVELAPIFCVGEKLEERNNNKHFQIVLQQLRESLFHLAPEKFKKIIIAYEPVWAIGTGVTATSAQAQEMHLFIRNEINKKYGNSISDSISILYGGSCNAKNSKELFSCPDVDGGLIGGASLKAGEFEAIINSF